MKTLSTGALKHPSSEQDSSRPKKRRKNPPLPKNPIQILHEAVQGESMSSIILHSLLHLFISWSVLLQGPNFRLSNMS